MDNPVIPYPFMNSIEKMREGERRYGRRDNSPMFSMQRYCYDMMTTNPLMDRQALEVELKKSYPEANQAMIDEVMRGLATNQ